MTEPLPISRAKALIHSYRQVHRAMNQLMRIHGDALGLTPVQILVIRTLAEEADLSLSDLASRIQLGCSTASGVVKRLVEAGIVERERLDEDQRTVAIRLTEKGNQLALQTYADDSMIANAISRFVHLPAEDVETLLKLNQRLLDVLTVDKETDA